MNWPTTGPMGILHSVSRCWAGAAIGRRRKPPRLRPAISKAPCRQPNEQWETCWLCSTDEPAGQASGLALHQPLAVLLIGDHPARIFDSGVRCRIENILDAVDALP